MITYLKGILAEKTPTYAVIDCSGVGYLLHISLTTYGKLGQEGKPCILFSHLQIKEDAHSLYGFFSQEERHLFRLLISVSGVGATTAQLMLSAMSVSELSSCIASENAGALQSIKGIGAKTAQRIVIELKDKIQKTDLAFAVTEQTSEQNSRAEALSALTLLGFAKPAAEKVLDKIIKESDGNLTVEELVKSGLKLL